MTKTSIEIGILRLISVILSKEPIGPKICKNCNGKLFQNDFPGKQGICHICNAIRVKAAQKGPKPRGFKRSKSSIRTAYLRRKSKKYGFVTFGGRKSG